MKVNAYHHVPTDTTHQTRLIYVYCADQIALLAPMVQHACCATTVKSCTTMTALLNVHKRCTATKVFVKIANNRVIIVAIRPHARVVLTTHTCWLAVHSVSKAQCAQLVTFCYKTSQNVTVNVQVEITT